MAKNSKIRFKRLKQIRNSFSSLDGYFLPFSDEFFEDVITKEDISGKLSDKLTEYKSSTNGKPIPKTIEFDLDDNRKGILSRISSEIINQ